MAKNKSGLPWLIALGVAGYVIYQLSSTPSGQSSDTSASRVVAQAASYARNALANTWPPLEEGSTVQVDMNAVAASNYYVVLDGSGSMSEVECSGGLSKIDAAVAALGKFVPTVPEGANLGLTVFDAQGISERVPLGVGNREAFHAALAQVRAESGTPLRSSMEIGVQQLEKQARRQLGYGEYHLVVVTDGIADPASEDPVNLVNTLLANSPVVLHTIGFCIGSDHALNQPGRSYYMAADSPQQLQESLGAVLAEAPVFDATTFTN